MKIILAISVIIAVTIGISTLFLMFAASNPTEQEDDDKTQMQFVKEYNEKHAQKNRK